MKITLLFYTDNGDPEMVGAFTGEGIDQLIFDKAKEYLDNEDIVLALCENSGNKILLFADGYKCPYRCFYIEHTELVDRNAPPKQLKTIPEDWYWEVADSYKLDVYCPTCGLYSRSSAGALYPIYKSKAICSKCISQYK